MVVSERAIEEKFGDCYSADERAFIMGIDQRFTAHFAERFSGLTVLETCSGAGFTTLSLARVAKHVFTVEVDAAIQMRARANIEKAGLSHKVTFLSGDVLAPETLLGLPTVDAAFLDPDWAVTGPEHIFRFRQSNTQPPADTLLERIFEITENVAMVLPPLVDVAEFKGLSSHERERLFLSGSHELFCLYFGSLAKVYAESAFHVG